MERFFTLFINPVLNKEIKLRFRSFKSFLGIFFYLAICGLVSLAFIYIESTFGYGGFNATDSRNLFMVLAIGQLGLVTFMTPGLTAGAISGEREMQTLNILLTTQQSSTSIVLSKLFSSLAFLVLMLFASLPLYSIVFLYGGVSPSMVVITFGFQLLSMFTIGSLGVMFSTIIRKTMIATITTYAMMLFFLVGTLILFVISLRFSMAYNPGSVSGGNEYLPYLFIMLNPIVTLFTIYEPSAFSYELQATGIEWPLWSGFVISYFLIAIVALIISIRRLRPSMKVKTRKKKE
ncbi:ABC transporter permease [Aquibacillus koreensis]|uniref:ABC transporter permease n=1 Tax=Aquibacillus koreensis TaxID=279446 RepID=A0A9X4AI92_9BACI|nr:ABC transporter permease subunit [Aquibacillus koreensis]MCT2534209.1 ABC transporter permease [Aquibacillus koreensis]MDC3420746.1 ABC transporter permease [Aquibacillus koreensis]